MTDTQTATVIGGGLSGPVTAMALQRAGIEATVYEAYASAADGIGGMLGLAPNGLDALAAIDLDGPVRQVAEPVSAIIVQSCTGKQLAQFADPSGKPIMHVVWRADLYRALYDEARRRGIGIEHSHRFVGASESGDGITARFSDHSTARADVLIGADGIQSTVRPVIDPAAPPLHPADWPGRVDHRCRPGLHERQLPHDLRQEGFRRQLRWRIRLTVLAGRPRYTAIRSGCGLERVKVTCAVSCELPS